MRRAWLGDLLLTATAAVLPLADLVGHGHARGGRGDAAVVLLVTVAAASLLLRRRWPIAVTLVSGCCAVLVTALGYRMPVAVLAPAVALYHVGLDGRRARSVAAAVIAAGVAVAAGRLLEADPFLSIGTLAHGALAMVPVLLGEVVAARRATLALLAERAELAVRAERDAQRLRIEQERRRIARDLHDIVGHALTTITVQAGVAAHLLAVRPEFAHDALAEISTAAGAALDDLRRLVGVLREPGTADASVEPEPALADIALLVDRARQCGCDATLTVTGDPDVDVPASMQVAAYRIVQEALTNVRRHAGPVPASVEIEVDRRRVRLRVCNPVPAGHRQPEAPIAGAGLVGMRERVAAHGGTLDAGPAPDGRFQVLARLPLPTGTASGSQT